MTERDHPHVAHDALRRAIEAGPDDFDHPGYDTLEALVNGRLPDADREAVETHIADCRECAEDLRDLDAMRVAVKAPVMPAMPAAARPRRLRVAALGSLAAGLVLAAWLGTRPGDPPTSAAPPVEEALATAPAVVSPLTADEQAIVERAINTGRLDVAAGARALAGRTGTLLGGGDRAAAFGPLAPTGTFVLSPTPAFTWQPFAGASEYTVAVFDDRFREVARGRVAGTSWMPATPLASDVAYVWQVTAHRPAGDVIAPAPPQPEARFRVIDAATAAIIAEQQARLANEPLALGVLLARAGLLADAASALARADSAAARALLASLRAQGVPTTTNPAQ